MTAADDANANADANADANDEATTTGDGATTNEPEDLNYDGNDLTNRFKYKVNALMGSYDPLQSDTDTEQTDGNIFNALLQFPTLYTFNIVGRTRGDDDDDDDNSIKDPLTFNIVGRTRGDDDDDDDNSIKDAYVEQVKSIVVNGCTCGSGSSSSGEEEDGGGIAVVDDTGDKAEDDTPTTVMGGAVDVIPNDATTTTTTTTTGVEMKDTVVCVVKPRGKNFTKITVEVMVENAAMINSVYEELGLLERTVMRF
eukprot:CAMPEP_0198279700 /NCGR_PEP_ID=MMETSP1447-20131203/67070_1 /TAXON_ID=420782 /ORGANISM="Chaetoceros dichaeta, Strain CCMP1751" /LENGTH=253 /DNA_ID=CAMNT_0043974905 /DNA_START=119 /DNA_END=881 /DNA_ORIENTATION=+